MRSALLLVTLAQLDGGVPGAGASPPPPFSSVIYGKCPVTEEKAIEVDGGWLLPTARAARASCLLASCEEDRRTRASGEVAPVPAWVWVVTAIAQVASAGAGVALTWAATHATPPPPSPLP